MACSTFCAFIRLFFSRAHYALFGTLLFALVAQPVRADVSAPQPSVRSDVNESSGAFGESIPIQVPKFHGVEPQLALSYSSSGGNGIVGVGWNLVADSFIERAGPGGGYPRYDSSDIYLLDGAELVSCTVLGGQYCTKHQGYQRITFNGAPHNGSGEWTVIDKSGTKRIYWPLYSSGTKTFRWVLKYITDTHDNMVTYDYDYAGSTDNNALLKTISYNNVVVTFHNETRPDPSNFATSWGLSANVKRLKTISVKVGTSFARAYALTYEASPGTNRSRLKTVKEVGRPTAVDAAGTITGGLSLPNPITFTYQDNNGIFGLAANGWAGNTIGLADGNIDWNGNYVSVYTGDFNGDGKTDILRQERGILADSRANNIRVYLANADGSFTLAPTDANGNASGLNEAGLNVTGSGPGWHGDRVDITLGDFNGDGKTDVLRVEKNGHGNDNGWNVMLFYASASNNGTFREGVGDGNANVPGLVPAGWPGSTWNGDLVDVQTGDFNADGKLDIVRLETNAWADNRTNNIMIFMNNGNETFSLAPTDGNGNALGLNEAGLNVNGTGPGWSTNNVNVHMSDMNGDGKTDIVRIEKNGFGNDGVYNFMIFYAASSGNGTFYQGLIDGNGNTVGLGGDWRPDLASVQFGDFNGDGKTDILRQEKGAWAMNGDTRGVVEIFLNVGDGSFRLGPLGWAYGALGLTSGDIDWNGDYTNLQVSDFNGDGKADVLRQEKGPLGGDGSNTVRIYFSNGDGSFRLQTPGWAGNVAGLADGNIDWNGDYAMIQLADFNGDGNLDVFRHEYSALGGDGANTVRTYLQPATAPDLLARIDNGMGGFTTVAYTPSSNWSRIYMPVGSISQTVSSVVVNDGRNLATSADTTTYSYFDANWSSALRRPFGFRVSQTRPSSGAYINTFHLQTLASPGTVSQVDTYSSAVKLLHSVKRTFAETTTLPYTSLLTQEDTVEHNGNTADGIYGVQGPFRTTRKVYQYDGTYGNVFILYDHGDIALTGDEYTTVSWSYVNPTKYIANETAFVQTFKGLTYDQSAMIKLVLNYYDNNTDYTLPPTKGDMTKVGHWNNITGSYSETKFTFDSYGNTISTTDPLNFTSTSYYDVPGGVHHTKSCNALPTPLCVETTWDLVLGQPLELKNPNGMITVYGYDNLGRKTSIGYKASATAAEEKRTTWTYQNFGMAGSQLIQEIEADDSPVDSYGIVGMWSNTYIDGLGRTWLVQKEGTTASTYTELLTYYNDASSQPWRVTHPYVAGTANPPYTTFAYDALNRPTRTTLPDGSFEETVYANDSAGKPYVRVTDAMSQQKTTWVDTDGRVIKIQERDAIITWVEGCLNGTGGGVSGDPCEPGLVPQTDWVYYITTFSYDTYDAQRNNVQTVTDHYGNVTSKTIDSLGRAISNTDPDRGTLTATYNAANQMLTSTDSRGNITVYTYDPIGRMKTRRTGTQLPLAEQKLTEYFYDEVGTQYGASKGQVTRIVYPNGSKTHKWNYLGQIVTDTTCIDTTPVCRPINQTFDAAGRLKTLTYPDGEVLTYNYTAEGHVASMSGLKPGGTVTNYVSSAVWELGRLKTLTYGNGTTNTYTYNTNRQWLDTASATVTSTGAVLYSSSYGYDLSARVISMTHDTRAATGAAQARSTTYTYDLLDRLKTVSGAQTQSFSYDGIGNITTNSLVGNYTYHATKKHAVSSVTLGAATTSYGYDAMGNMNSVSGPGVSATLVWDAQNRLTRLTRNSIITDFVYDETTQRIKKTTGGISTYYFNRFVEKVGVNDEHFYYAGPMLVAKKKIEPTTSSVNWYHADRLGSVRLMTNNVGTEVKEYDYKAFGATDSSGGTATNERGYTGHITDAESNLIYMGARYYDATLGRFIASDTVIPAEDNPQAYNRYSYVYNNPMHHTDPSGNIPVAVAVPLMSAIGGALVAGTATAMTGGDVWEIIRDAVLGAASGGATGRAMQYLGRFMKVRLERMNKHSQVQTMVERASIQVFGAGGAVGNTFAEAVNGERNGGALLAAFVMGYTGGSIGAFARGFGFALAKDGTRKTYNDVLKAAAKKYMGSSDKISVRLMFKTTRGGLVASYIAGVAAQKGLSIAKDDIAKGINYYAEKVRYLNNKIGNLADLWKDDMTADRKRHLEKLRQYRDFWNGLRV